MSCSRIDGLLSKTFTFSLTNEPPWRLVLVLAAWLSTAGNWALWTELIHLNAMEGFRGWGFAAAFALMIAAATVALLTLAAWPRVLRVWCSVWVLVAAFSAHYMATYHVVIDTSMIVNVFQTDAREVRDLLSLRMLFTVLLIAGPALWWIWRKPVAFGPWLVQLGRNALMVAVSLVVVVAAVWLVFQDFSSTMRNHKHVRFLINPLNSAFALVDMAWLQGKQRPAGLQAIGQDAKLGASYVAPDKPLLLVLVLGETARAKNFALNGYERATTPELSALLSKSELVNFPQVQSCGTSTAESLPCMFAHLGRSAYADRPANYENLLDVLQRAGLAVFWLDNQSGCKGLCDRVPSANTSESGHPQWCEGGECLDEVMLDKLDERLAALPAERRAKGVVLVMHQMGSHGPAYFKRSPAGLKPFSPECRSINLQDCARQDVVNAYDNSVVYTDHFLGQTIAWLNQRQNRASAAMLYVADHGESLGENNLYLHGLPYAMAPEDQKHVPMVLWMSQGFQKRTGLSVRCLDRQAREPLSHDNLFHSMLGLADVSSAEYRQDKDFSAACRTSLSTR